MLYAQSNHYGYIRARYISGQNTIHQMVDTSLIHRTRYITDFAVEEDWVKVQSMN